MGGIAGVAHIAYPCAQTVGYIGAVVVLVGIGCLNRSLRISPTRCARSVSEGVDALALYAFYFYVGHMDGDPHGFYQCEIYLREQMVEWQGDLVLVCNRLRPNQIFLNILGPDRISEGVAVGIRPETISGRSVRQCRYRTHGIVPDGRTGLIDRLTGITPRSAVVGELECPVRGSAHVIRQNGQFVVLGKGGELRRTSADGVFADGCGERQNVFMVGGFFDRFLVVATRSREKQHKGC